jgi:hypothetical protein
MDGVRNSLLIAAVVLLAATLVSLRLPERLSSKRVSR